MLNMEVKNNILLLWANYFWEITADARIFSSCVCVGVS